MAGYSGTPQSRKLGLKPGMRVAVIGADAAWHLQDPPELLVAEANGPADLVLVFLREAAEVESVFATLGARIFPAGTLWAAWPRRAAGHVSDLSDTVLREAALPLGLVDVKVAAIDHDWSGLKFVWRVGLRG